MEYQQRDLGYPRTKTDAVLVLTMPDGARWAVPAQIVADSRDDYYKEDQEDTIGFIREKSLDEFELIDWAQNNMNAEDFEGFEHYKEPPRTEPNFEDAWETNSGELSIEGEI